MSLTEQDVYLIRQCTQEVRRLKKQAAMLSQQSLAEKFGVGRQTIYDAIHGYTWSHVPFPEDLNMHATVIMPEYSHAKRMRQAALDICPEPKTCPFCGGDSLIANDWIVGDEAVPAYECSNCDASAPARVWNRRT